jgi:hypothetical protein
MVVVCYVVFFSLNYIRSDLDISVYFQCSPNFLSLLYIL